MFLWGLGIVELAPRLDNSDRIRQSGPQPHRLLMPNWLAPQSAVTQIEICSRGNSQKSGAERREWDSNPRRLAPHSFSRAAHLSALPSLQARHARGVPSALRVPTGEPGTPPALSRWRQPSRVPLLVLPVGRALIAQAPAQAPALGLSEDHLAKAHDLWRHLDAFVVGDELESVLE